MKRQARDISLHELDIKFNDYELRIGMYKEPPRAGSKAIALTIEEVEIIYKLLKENFNFEEKEHANKG